MLLVLLALLLLLCGGGALAACDPARAKNRFECLCDPKWFWNAGSCISVKAYMNLSPVCQPGNATFAEECACDSTYRWRKNRCYNLYGHCKDYKKPSTCPPWCAWSAANHTCGGIRGFTPPGRLLHAKEKKHGNHTKH